LFDDDGGAGWGCGTKGLRVCDASVLPVVPRGNVLAAVYGWAEKLVEIILREEGVGGV
jgi:choline dehydrogenase-like flavoprotein